jgi:hypothetical protein
LGDRGRPLLLLFLKYLDSLGFRTTLLSIADIGMNGGMTGGLTTA